VYVEKETITLDVARERRVKSRISSELEKRKRKTWIARLIVVVIGLQVKGLRLPFRVDMDDDADVCSSLVGFLGGT
jgi:hypothetical protein